MRINRGKMIRYRRDDRGFIFEGEMMRRGECKENIGEIKQDGMTAEA